MRLIDPANLTELRAVVRILQEQARGRIRADRARLWPHVTDDDFDAVVNAVGEVSVGEARDGLTRMERGMTRPVRGRV